MPKTLKKGVALLLCAAFLFLLAPQAMAAPLIVYKRASAEGKKRIALTFDDGPHPRYTPQILDILKKYGVKATFFAVGENAETYPALMERMVAEGHEIGNHTYNHYHTPKMDNQTLRQDILACDEALVRLTGKEVRLFRPPEGVCNDEICAVCEEKGYTIVMWSIDTRDWAHTPPQDMIENVKKHATDGAIILMHDFIGKNSKTPEALRGMIPMLQGLGYEFCTVGELLS